MRVLAVSATGLISGAELVLLRYAASGSHAGDRWTIAAPAGRLHDEARRLEVDHLGATHHLHTVVLPDLKLPTGPRAVAGLRLARRQVWGARILRSEAQSSDVVVCNSLMALPAVRLARPSCPVVWLVHDVVTRGELRRVARWSAPSVARAVAVSEASAEFPRSLGIDVTVVRNGVELPTELADPVDDLPAGDLPIVGLNAMLTPWKGQAVLLDALSIAETPFVVELLGGTFPKDEQYESELRSIVAARGMTDRVRFLGHHNDPLAVMRRWTVGVSASVEPEAGPLAVLEAMSIGLPVVVSAHGGGAELASGHGLLTPPGDATALARAIDTYLADPDRRRRDGDRARRWVERHARIDQAEDRFAATVRSVASGERNGEAT